MRRDWQVLASTSVGPAHLRQGEDGQDAFMVTERDGLLVAAVCDGAGSAPLGGVGATMAATVAVRAATARFTEIPDTTEGWHSALEALFADVASRFTAAAAVVARAVAGRARTLPPLRRRGGSVQDLGTTLTLLVASPPWVGVVAVGDGFVVTRSGGDRLELLVRPDPEGPRADTVTLLTSPAAVRTARRSVLRDPDLTGLCMGTDGLCDAALEFRGSWPQAPLPGFFHPVFGWAEDGSADVGRLTRLLASDRLDRVTEDDRTLLVAVRTGAGR
jgi:hypothetical protein